jgi:hypothetical protein
MEVTRIANALVFTLIPGFIILATLVLGIVRQSKTVPAPDRQSKNSKLYPSDDLIMCLADVSVSRIDREDSR